MSDLPTLWMSSSDLVGQSLPAIKLQRDVTSSKKQTLAQLQRIHTSSRFAVIDAACGEGLLRAHNSRMLHSARMA
ncbi:MAG: hypothetical protein AAFU69_06795, partial [Pseudomonadota bacterium]